MKDHLSVGDVGAEAPAAKPKAILAVAGGNALELEDIMSMAAVIGINAENLNGFRIPFYDLRMAAGERFEQAIELTYNRPVLPELIPQCQLDAAQLIAFLDKEQANLVFGQLPSQKSVDSWVAVPNLAKL